MKRLFVVGLLLTFLLSLAGCGAGESLETWPITYNDQDMGVYAKAYDTVESMLAEEHIIFRGKAAALVEEKQYGVILELETIESTGDVSGTIQLRQMKDPDFLLKKGEEVVLILHTGYGDGVWEVFNDDHGMFRIDQETGDMSGRRLESLMENVPQTYSVEDGSDLTLEQVYDLLVEMDNAA